MPLFTEVPYNNPKLHDQKELSNLSDKEFLALFDPTFPSAPMRFFRAFCFLFFLGPLKILLTIFSLFVFFVVVSILPIFRRFFKTSRQFKNWAFHVVRPLFRLCLLGTGIVKINVRGEIHPDARTIVANHMTILDAVLLLYQFPVSYLAAAYLSKYKFIVNYSKVFDLVFVDRTKRQNISQHLIDIANDPMLLPVMVFPEGKVTNGDALVGFRSGAYISETLVQPLAIRYRMWLTPKTMSTVSWNEEPFLTGYIYQFFAIPWITVDIDVLEPIKWKGSDKTAQERAFESELQIANALGCLACSRTNKDLFKEGTVDDPINDPLNLPMVDGSIPIPHAKID